MGFCCAGTVCGASSHPPVTAAIPADFDLNQQVDVADLSNWAVSFGQAGVSFGDGIPDKSTSSTMEKKSVYSFTLI